MSSFVERLRLYVVTDERSDVDSLLTATREALQGGATVIQLRRKTEEGRKLVEMGHAIRTMTRQFGALYIVNDRVDVALLTDADGVHVGQSDIACGDVRRLIGEKIIGVSASNLTEAREAIRQGADYLGVGSIYPTLSKPDADLSGLGNLAAISEATDVPIVAIGGITLERTQEVLTHGATGIAVVSAVMSAKNPRQAAEEFLRML